MRANSWFDDEEKTEEQKVELLMFTWVRILGEFAGLVADFTKLDKLALWQKTFRAIIKKSKGTYFLYVLCINPFCEAQIDVVI